MTIVRRGVLAAVLVGVTGLGGAAAPAAASAFWFLPDGRVAREPTVPERRRAATFVTSARAAMVAWTDPTRAMAAGYEPDSQGVIVHYLDPTRLLGPSEAPDPTRPTALVFAVVRGSPHLAGAMWMMAFPSTAGADFGGPITPWHAHVACRSAYTVRLVARGAACAPREVREISPEMLHVWRAGVLDPFASDMSLPALVCTLGLRPAAPG